MQLRVVGAIEAIEDVLSLLDAGLKGTNPSMSKLLVDTVAEMHDEWYERLCKIIEHDFDVGIPGRKIAKERGISRQRVHTILSNRKKKEA